MTPTTLLALVDRRRRDDVFTARIVTAAAENAPALTRLAK